MFNLLDDAGEETRTLTSTLDLCKFRLGHRRSTELSMVSATKSPCRHFQPSLSQFVFLYLYRTLQGRHCLIRLLWKTGSIAQLALKFVWVPHKRPQSHTIYTVNLPRHYIAKLCFRIHNTSMPGTPVRSQCSQYVDTTVVPFACKKDHA